MVNNDSMDAVLAKAQTLIEALPYIQKFNGTKVVVKYGGSAMVDENLKYNVIKDVALLKLIGMKPIVVHGGGKEISAWLKKIGKESEFINGLRVTDEETLEVAEMVLSKVNKSLVSHMQKLGLRAVGISGKEISAWLKKIGKESEFINGLRVTDEETLEVAEMVLSKVNKSLVSHMQKLGLRAVGISGKDSGILKVKKKYSDGKDIGYVGEVVETDHKLIDTLIENDFIPVIAPIGYSEEDFHGYNINADDAACAVATALNAEKLVFLTDIEGVFMDPEDKSTLVSQMTIDEAQAFIDKGVVGGGMLPKLSNCIEAMKNGVSRVHMLDGRVEHCLLLEFFTEKGIGTAIVNS